jgi:hypothetical protein
MKKDESSAVLHKSLMPDSHSFITLHSAFCTFFHPFFFVPAEWAPAAAGRALVERVVGRGRESADDLALFFVKLPPVAQSALAAARAPVSARVVHDPSRGPQPSHFEFENWGGGG